MNTMFKRFRVITLIISALGFSSAVYAADVEPYVSGLYHGWEHVRYEMPSDQQEKAYADLKNQADEVISAHPEDASAWIWRGIITSTYAGAKGGLGALSLVDEARTSLEKAIELDPHAFGGAAFTSLGALYYQVPGWPISFGDDDKARELLEKGLAMNPEGMDANFFYGDFLAEQGEDDQARKYLNKALSATPRPDRPKADAGRKGEIQAVLSKLD